MSINQKIRAIERLFKEVDIKTRKYAELSGTNCLQNCSKCCTTNNISASPLEFLPAARQLFVTNKYEPVLESIEDNKVSGCILLTPIHTEAPCIVYEHRGLICRLFGYSAHIDKHGNKKPITCKPIKDNILKENLSKSINKAPNITDYYRKLYNIWPSYSYEQFPVNQAIKKALELVLFHNHFKKKRA